MVVCAGSDSGAADALDAYPMKEKDYESTVMRIAGNLLSGVDLYLYTDDADGGHGRGQVLVERAVARARAIVTEVQRTKPEARETPPERDR